MRLSFVILAAMASLLASCDAASTSEQTTRSTMTSPGVVGDTPRFLRKHEADEERGFNLQKLDDLLGSLEVAEANMLATLGKFDTDILKKIDNISGARARINRWKEAEWDPTSVAAMLKRDYPSLSLQGAEWKTWRLYAAQYLRQYHSLNPTV